MIGKIKCFIYFVQSVLDSIQSTKHDTYEALLRIGIVISSFLWVFALIMLLVTTLSGCFKDCQFGNCSASNVEKETSLNGGQGNAVGSHQRLHSPESFPKITDRRSKSLGTLSSVERLGIDPLIKIKFVKNVRLGVKSYSQKQKVEDLVKTINPLPMILKA